MSDLKTFTCPLCNLVFTSIDSEQHRDSAIGFYVSPQRYEDDMMAEDLIGHCFLVHKLRGMNLMSTHDRSIARHKIIKRAMALEFAIDTRS